MGKDYTPHNQDYGVEKFFYKRERCYLYAVYLKKEETIAYVGYRVVDSWVRLEDAIASANNQQDILNYLRGMK